MRKITFITIWLAIAGTATAQTFVIENEEMLQRVERELENRFLKAELERLNLPTDKIKLDDFFLRQSTDDLLHAHGTQSIHRPNFTEVAQLVRHDGRDRNIAAVGALVATSLLTQRADGGYDLDTTRTVADVLGVCRGPNVQFSEQPCVASCAATLVSPKIAITAGHCIENGLWHDRLVVFDYAPSGGATAPPTLYPSQNVYCIAYAFGPAGDSGSPDWGILVLDRPVENRAPAPIRQNGDVALGDGLYIISYPAGTPLIFAGGASVTDVQDADTFMADVNTLERSSGSPVINEATDVIEGIFVRGDKWLDTEEDCRIPLYCPPKEECAHEEITRIRCLPLIPDANGVLQVTELAARCSG